MNKFINDQNWRYATKKFDSTKKINQEDLNILKEAIRLSASSFGLQPYKIILVDNTQLRTEIQKAAWGQSQVTEASHVIVFANVVDFGDAEIDTALQHATITRNLPIDALNDYGAFMKSKISTLPVDERNSWTSKQTYLALGNLLNAAAELKIDATPMEGFDPKQVNEILGLDKLGLNASLLATIGYRHEEDKTQHFKKVRKSNEDLFINL